MLDKSNASYVTFAQSPFFIVDLNASYGFFPSISDGIKSHIFGPRKKYNLQFHYKQNLKNDAGWNLFCFSFFRGGSIMVAGS